MGSLIDLNNHGSCCFVIRIFHVDPNFLRRRLIYYNIHSISALMPHHYVNGITFAHHML